MSVEICYALTSEAHRPRLEQVMERFRAAGLPCGTEPEGENMVWLVFDSRDSSVLASLEDGAVVFATLHLGDDGPDFVERVDGVMEEMGFSAGGDEEYSYE